MPLAGMTHTRLSPTTSSARFNRIWVASFAAIASLITASAGANAPADPLLGRWKSPDRGGLIELHRCGPAICGRVLDGASLRANPDLRDTRNGDKALRTRLVKGMRIFDGFTGGPREWTGGSLYDPETGYGTKTGFLTLKDANTLEVKGCVARVICQTQTLVRAR